MIDARPFRFELPCPHCGKVDMQIIGELVGKDEITCRYCGEMIDLTDENWQASLKETIESLNALYRIK